MNERGNGAFLTWIPGCGEKGTVGETFSPSHPCHMVRAVRGAMARRRYQHYAWAQQNYAFSSSFRLDTTVLYGVGDSREAAEAAQKRPAHHLSGAWARGHTVAARNEAAETVY
jgi:hypothetical protein